MESYWDRRDKEERVDLLDKEIRSFLQQNKDKDFIWLKDKIMGKFGINLSYNRIRHLLAKDTEIELEKPKNIIEPKKKIFQEDFLGGI